MAKYVSVPKLQDRLKNKISFGTVASTTADQMPPSLFNDLINEAEADMEVDLMIRYDTPFHAVDDIHGNPQPYSALPAETQFMLRTLAELLAAIRVLETDFGRGTSANGEKYTEKLQKRYDSMIAKLVEFQKNSYSTWLKPPLRGLALAYCNGGDSGFRGRVHNTTVVRTESGEWATNQINAPGESLFNGQLDRPERPDDAGDGE
jgi:hypothetical protein